MINELYENKANELQSLLTEDTISQNLTEENVEVISVLEDLLNSSTLYLEADSSNSILALSNTVNGKIFEAVAQASYGTMKDILCEAMEVPKEDQVKEDEEDEGEEDEGEEDEVKEDEVKEDEGSEEDEKEEAEDKPEEEFEGEEDKQATQEALLDFIGAGTFTFKNELDNVGVTLSEASPYFESIRQALIERFIDIAESDKEIEIAEAVAITYNSLFEEDKGYELSINEGPKWDAFKTLLGKGKSYLKQHGILATGKKVASKVWQHGKGAAGAVKGLASQAWKSGALGKAGMVGLGAAGIGALGYGAYKGIKALKNRKANKKGGAPVSESPVTYLAHKFLATNPGYSFIKKYGPQTAERIAKAGIVGAGATGLAGAGVGGRAIYKKVKANQKKSVPAVKENFNSNKSLMEGGADIGGGEGPFYTKGEYSRKSAEAAQDFSKETIKAMKDKEKMLKNKVRFTQLKRFLRSGKGKVALTAAGLAAAGGAAYGGHKLYKKIKAKKQEKTAIKENLEKTAGQLIQEGYADTVGKVALGGLGVGSAIGLASAIRKKQKALAKRKGFEMAAKLQTQPQLRPAVREGIAWTNFADKVLTPAAKEGVKGLAKGGKFMLKGAGLGAAGLGAAGVGYVGTKKVARALSGETYDKAKAKNLEKGMKKFKY